MTLQRLAWIPESRLCPYRQSESRILRDRHAGPGPAQRRLGHRELGRDTGFTEKDSVTLNSGNPTGTLNYTARAYDASYGVPLTVNVSSSTPDVPDYAYGELAGAVHFSNAQGFVFESDGQQSDSHTLR